MVALYSRKYARTGRRSEAQATPGTLEELGTNYKKRDIVSLNISGRFGPEAADKFKKDLADSLRSGQTYSHLKSSGATCSASIFKAFLSLPAKGETFGLWWSKVIYKVAGSAFSPFLPLGLLNVIPPSFIYVVAKEMEVRVAHDATVGTRVDLTGVVNAGDNAELAGLAGALALAGANPSLSPEAPVSRQPPTDDEEEPSQQALQDPSDDEDHEDHEDHEDALPGDSPQDPETDEDDDGKDLEDLEDLEEEARLASDSQDARPGDAPQQPAIDDDDDEDVLTDDRAQQPATDDDDAEPSRGDDEEEELEDASDHEDAPSADALMQAAKADVGADATADDQAGPRLATSAPVAADDGFSFSLFPKPGVPTEVAKEAMPANQAPPEESSGSGMPASEGAHADLEDADVGNAAPSNERVVHHGDLAP